VATKADLDLLEQRIGKQIAEAQMRTSDLINRTLLTLGSITIAASGLIIAAIKIR